MFFKQNLTPYDRFCGEFCAEDWGTDQSSRSVYGTIVFILQFVVPFFIITFCYLMISLRLGRVSLLLLIINYLFFSLGHVDQEKLGGTEIKWTSIRTTKTSFEEKVEDKQNVNGHG